MRHRLWYPIFLSFLLGTGLSLALAATPPPADAQGVINALTNANGWGTMDRAVWQDQIQQYADLGQFTKRVPKVDEVMTMDILNATREYRVRNS